MALYRPRKLYRGWFDDSRWADATGGREAPQVHVPVDRYGRPDPAKLADAEEQKARPWQAYRSGYYGLIGPAPECGPRETWKAKAYLDRIDAARDMGGWSGSERRNLCRLAKTWARRAAGQDPRFNLFGNRRGQLSQDDMRLVRSLRGY